MNAHDFSLKKLKLLYYQYRDTFAYQAVLVVVLVGVGIYLVVQFVLPQITTYFSVQREVEAVQGRIAAIEANDQFLTAHDSATVDEQKELVIRALPFRTDFSGIINALSYVSSVTGVPVGEFRIDVGDDSLGAGVVSTIDFQFSLPTDIDGTNRFIQALSEVLPLASVSDVSYNGAVTTVLLSFYHRGLPQIETDVTQRIEPLTADELNLISRLRQYGDRTRRTPSVGSPIATQSGDIEIAIPPL